MDPRDIDENKSSDLEFSRYHNLDFTNHQKQPRIRIMIYAGLNDRIFNQNQNNTADIRQIEDVVNLT